VIRYVWRTFLAERLARSVSARTAAGVDARIAAVLAEVRTLAARMEERVGGEVARTAEALRTEIRDSSAATLAHSVSRMEEARPWHRTVFLPGFDVAPRRAAPFMAYSTPCSGDFATEEFVRICAELATPPQYHRKLWEWAFIVHHLKHHDMIRPGTRGLVFGVGTEPLPSRFIRDGAEVVATDAPAEIGAAAGWEETNEYAATLERVRNPAIVDAEAFAARARYATCDMNAIGPEFRDFDFCWSACCLEHLGDLKAGMDFVVNSVEQTLRVGGIACHTTELNLSSDEDTVSTGPTVLYRKRDILGLVERLRERGHAVDEVRIAPDLNPLDFYVDVPPYSHNPHLKLSLMGYTSTSVGLVIRRGR
jgi:hypothetical protein